MERPALQQLLADIQARRIDVIVVYKVDRLTRSLSDFARMVEIFDATGVSFVSVTQQFNTTTSMGRLTLNVLLSFAQFEREVTGERIRDKIAASKKKGMWMGGSVPLGYEVKERKLLIKPSDAETVRHIFRRYIELGCVRLLQKDITEHDIRSVNGHILSRGTLYKMLANPIYIGQIRHKDVYHPGQHASIIDQELWDQVQQCLAGNRIGNKMHSRKTEPSSLAGKLFDALGEPLVPVHANKKGRRYRYYVSKSLLNNPKKDAINGWRLPAQEIERTIMHLADDTQQHGHALKIEDIQRVELGLEDIRLTYSITGIPITRDFPMQMKRRGVEMKMIIGNSLPTRIDQTLIRAIARAHQWVGELFSGCTSTMAAISSRESIDKGSLSRMMNLAFLAPDIVEAILAGHQPASLTLQKLLRTTLPLDWEEQKNILGFRNQR
jgi:site-specific DNA recombinase